VIDIHTHPVQIAELHDADPALEHAVKHVFGLFVKPQPLATYFAQLDEAGIERAVVLPIDCTTAHGCTIVSNDQIAALVEEHPRLIGFASVDPGQVDAADRLRGAVARHPFAGVKLDPALQRFAIDDEQRAFPVYATCAELNLPVMIHCGLSWAAEGRSSFAHPLALEAVVHAFPTLRIIVPHLAWPWTADAVMLALKHRNVHLDTSVLFSGTPPESLRHVVEHVIGREVFDRSLPEQVLFGSNYPRVDPKRAAHAVRDLGLRPALERRILHDNAHHLLGLS
jgi:predicted TIM-barrel fold metal-dependent hydrolase